MLYSSFQQDRIPEKAIQVRSLLDSDITFLPLHFSNIVVRSKADCGISLVAYEPKKGYVKLADRKKEIYDLLIKIRDLSEAFNNMGGYLYSSICADEINEIINTLKNKYDVNVNYWQPSDGRVSFTNLQSLIEKYEESGK